MAVSAGAALPQKSALRPRRRRADGKNIQGETDMGMVMIKCPTSGRAIATGMEADRAGFGRSPVFFARTFCAICKSNHEWFAKEAWVHEVDGKRQASRPAHALEPA